MLLLVMVLMWMFLDEGRARECEPLRLSFCENMGYKRVRLPNIFNQNSQGEAEAVLNSLRPLSLSGCFAHLSFFLCGAYVPPCIGEVGGSVSPSPCRHICELARNHCYGVMLQMNLTEIWPDCMTLKSEVDDSTCLTPNSRTPRDKCRCLNTKMPHITQDLFNNRDFDYGIKAKVMDFLPGHYPTLVRVAVLDVFQSSSIEVNEGTDEVLLVEDTCKCPELKLGRSYLIMGYEDYDRPGLLLNQSSVVVGWRDAYRTNLRRWSSVNEDRVSQRYNHYRRNYYGIHGYHLQPRGPSFFQTMLLVGAYDMYRRRQYKNKVNRGFSPNVPAYGGYKSGYGGGYGAGFAGGYGGYGQQTSYSRPLTRNPSYPASRSPAYPVSRAPAYPVTNRPSYPASRAPGYPASTRRPATTRSTRRSWGSRSSRSRSSRGRSGGGRRG